MHTAYYIHVLLFNFALRYFPSVVYKDAGTFLYSVNLFESVSVHKNQRDHMHKIMIAMF